MVSFAFFEVAPADDDAFLAAWRRAREATDAGDVALHRALRDDAGFRFVAVARRPVVALPEGFRACAGDYEIVRAVGAPDGAGGALRVEPFVVPAGEDDAFLAAYDALAAALDGAPGRLGVRLHRAVAGPELRFVDLARWSSPLMLARAQGLAAVRDAVAAMRFAGRPALYLPVAV